jgi:uncharacterized protein YdaU (DUF1376 family)
MGNPTDIWMPLYIGDYLAETQHLSAEQSGAYLHLLMHEWRVGPLPLDLDVLRRIARVEKDAWSNAWAMLEHFFTRTEAGYTQPRLELEKVKSQENRERFSNRGKAAAEKRWSKMHEHATSNAHAMLDGCPSPSPSPSPIKQKQKQKTLALTALAVPAGAFITLPLNDGSDFPVNEELVLEWQGLYPAIDVRQQIRNYRGWAISNPTNRKTRKGILKSVNFWLAKAQNQSRPMKGQTDHGDNGRNANPAAQRQQTSNDNIGNAVRNLISLAGPADGTDQGGLPEPDNHRRDGNDASRSLVRDGLRERPGAIRSSSTKPLQIEQVLTSAR